MGGMVLHEGNVAEMKTGEGKTLVATLPLYLNALTSKGRFRFALQLLRFTSHESVLDGWSPVYEFSLV